MDLILSLVDFILHIDVHLKALFADYGVWIYAILFLIIFCETGLVVMPFLPGDSLLFAAGALTVDSALDVHLLSALLVLAAVLGDLTNYTLGRLFGERLFSRSDSRLFRQDHLHQTHAFFARHGGKAIIIARFAPIVRTFAPFVAGMGKMSYPRFMAFNGVGALCWVLAFVYVGHFFGNLPLVKENFTLLIFVIIVISLLPMVIAAVRARLGKGQS
ncbi:MAG: DedA family protein [Aeromonas molluscorum]|jgi:membrane-associated protein|uniref:DedA family protein n=1 Tax=Aeromonas molluscorum TaxID=271417 RepID=UPI003C9C0D33